MTENRKNWLYPEASGLYFPHDGFIMRASDGKQYDIEEECELLNEYHKGYNECRNDVLRLEKENEQLKQQLSEAKADEKQLGISFMGYKMKLIEVLQKKYDKVKGKTLYADVYTEIAEEMGVDLE